MFAAVKKNAEAIALTRSVFRYTVPLFCGILNEKPVADRTVPFDALAASRITPGVPEVPTVTSIKAPWPASYNRAKVRELVVA